MKVLDLQCTQGHTFEGWFASEDDFVMQGERGMLHCPLCGDVSVRKKLSAPRLNLGAAREVGSEGSELTVAAPVDASLTAAWMAVAKQIIANTTDVGQRFAEEARKIHYGEVPEHAIRGTTSISEARELIDEGIAVLPMHLPASLKEPLQ